MNDKTLAVIGFTAHYHGFLLATREYDSAGHDRDAETILAGFHA
ncbi:hypothetical protein [Mycolicibacterium phlei]